MARTLSWRPDRFHQPNCDDCHIYPAVINGRCVRCDHARWEAEKAAMAAQQATDLAALAEKAERQDAATLEGVLQAEYRDADDTERDLLAGLHW